jgi:hypothetical protein
MAEPLSLAVTVGTHPVLAPPPGMRVPLRLLYLALATFCLSVRLRIGKPPPSVRGRCRWPPGAVAAPGLGAASALGLIHEFSGRRCALDCTRRSDTCYATQRSCRASHCSPQNAMWAYGTTGTSDGEAGRDQQHPKRGDVAGIDAVRMSKREQHLALRDRFHDH